MTRGDAIEILKSWTLDRDYAREAIALDMAIKALEQEPCDDTVSIRKVDELISREAANQRIKGICEKYGLSYGDTCERVGSGNAFYHAFDDLPSVTQKSGKWIDYSDEGYVECPFCGHATNCEDNIDELHYCFYCGARMVEPQESEG